MVRELKVNKVNGDVRYEWDPDAWDFEDDEEFFESNLRGAATLHEMHEDDLEYDWDEEAA